MNTPIPAQDVRPEPDAINRSCILALDLGTTTGWALRRRYAQKLVTRDQAAA